MAGAKQGWDEVNHKQDYHAAGHKQYNKEVNNDYGGVI